MRTVAGEQYLEMQDVADFLNIKLNTLYKIRSRENFQELHSIKWGHQLLFKQDDVRTWWEKRGAKEKLKVK